MFKNVASQKITFLVIDTANNVPKTGDSANLTAYVSKDDGAVTVLGDTSATELDATNAPGLYSFDLTQAETNADKLLFSGKSSTSGVRVVPLLLYTDPSGFGDLTIANNATAANVTRFGGTAGTFSSGRPEVNTTHWGGTAVASAVVSCNAIQISGDSVAADNAESFFDGTGYAGTNNVIPTVTTLTNDPSGVTTLLSRVGTPSNLGGGATLAQNLSDIEAQTDDIGTNGAGLTGIPWNAAWDAEVQSECTDALNAYDPPTNAEMEARTMPAAQYATAAEQTTQAGYLASILADTAEIGAAGAGLTAVPYNSAWDAQIESEVADALAAIGLDHLITSADPGGVVADNSFWAKLHASGVTADYTDYDHTTRSLMALGTYAQSLDEVDLPNVLTQIAALAASIAALPDAAAINAQVLDVLTVDTFAEPSAVPSATATLAGKIGWLAALARNKVTQTSTTQTLRNDADDANIATAAHADDGSVHTRSEWT